MNTYKVWITATVTEEVVASSVVVEPAGSLTFRENVGDTIQAYASGSWRKVEQVPVVEA